MEEMETGRIIIITGQSSMEVKPDTTELTIELNDSGKKYDDVIKKYRKETAAVKRAFAKIGFGKDDFETKKFDIDTLYKSFPIHKGLYFAGYHFTHTMKLCFPVDGERIGAVLKTLKSLRMSERILKLTLSILSKMPPQLRISCFRKPCRMQRKERRFWRKLQA